MAFQTIITAEELSKNINNSSWLILDCRGTLTNNHSSYHSFFMSHIPNAFYCCDEQNAGSQSYKHQSIQDSSEQIKAALIESGFNKDTQIIIYDQENSTSANNIWLQLRAMGMQSVAVLQGGFTYWEAKGYPVTSAKKETYHYVTYKQKELLVS